MISTDIIELSLREARIEAFGLLDEARLRDACREMPAALQARLGLGDSCGAIVAALPYGEGPDFRPAAVIGAFKASWVSPVPSAEAASVPKSRAVALSATAAEAQNAEAPNFRAVARSATAPNTLGRIARFARANWYAELGARLKDAGSRIACRLRNEGRDPGPRSGREWRYFVNSAFPEKRLAIEAGLGELGLHGLVMLPSHGSAAVLGLLLVPKSAAALLAAGCASRLAASSRGSLLISRNAEHSSAQSLFCKDCEGACVAACPSGALGGDGSFERELCLQHWSAIAGSLPGRVEKAWGDRLYGCDSCQEACPKFRPDDAARTTRGLLGPGLPAAWIVSSPEEGIRTKLRKTALGMSWISIEALRRNAALALRNSSCGQP